LPCTACWAGYENQFGGWNLSLFSASPELLSCLQLRADRQFKAKNGPLDCVQKNYHLAEKAAASRRLAEDYANRLRKNLKKFEKWARQEGIECYRLYDADLPEYNVASIATVTGWWCRSMRRRKPSMRKKRVSVCLTLLPHHRRAGYCAEQAGAENPRAAEREKPVSEDGREGRLYRVANITRVCGST
jgi:hypothetical protein